VHVLSVISVWFQVNQIQLNAFKKPNYVNSQWVLLIKLLIVSTKDLTEIVLYPSTISLILKSIGEIKAL